MVMFARSHSSIIPGAFGGSPPRLRLYMPPSDGERAKDTASNGGAGERSLGNRTVSMDFGLLFDTVDNGAGDPMETVREEYLEEPPSRPRLNRAEPKPRRQERYQMMDAEDAMDPMLVHLR